MQGRIAGFLMTLLLALPLAAIPLISIFGIPQFGSLAATFDDKGFLLEDPHQAGGDAAAWDLDSAPSYNAAAASDATDQNPALMNEATYPATTNSNLNAWSDTPSTNSGQPFTSVNTESSTWQQAVQQLAAYGIEDYRLQPGSQSQGFHFACFSRCGNNHSSAHAGGGNETIIRFEAEAADPLQAVQQTIEQVERWFGRPPETAAASLL